MLIGADLICLVLDIECAHDVYQLPQEYREKGAAECVAEEDYFLSRFVVRFRCFGLSAYGSHDPYRWSFGRPIQTGS